VATGALSGGDAAPATNILQTGTHAITASYAGDGSFEASDSSAGSVTVLKSNSEIRIVATATEFLTAGTFVRINVQVGVPQRVASAGGVVSVSADGAVAIQQSLVGSVAMFRVPLSAGPHQLVISYAGIS